MPRLIIRPDVLDRIKDLKGIKTDEAMAAIGGVSLSTYRRYKNGDLSPSGDFIARMVVNLGYSLEALATVQESRGSQAA